MKARYLKGEAAELHPKVARMVAHWFKDETGFPATSTHFLTEWHDVWMFVFEANGRFFHAQVGGIITADNALVVTNRELMEMHHFEQQGVHTFPLTIEDDPLILAWFTKRNLAAIGRMSNGKFTPTQTTLVT